MSRSFHFFAVIAGAIGLALTAPGAAQLQPQQLTQLAALARVPDLADNLTIQAAPALLRSAGLQPGSFRCAPSSGAPGARVGRVTAFSPGSGTSLPRGSRVDMVAVLPNGCQHFASSMAIIVAIQSMHTMSHAHPPPPPPPPPATQTCPDGSVILATDGCPVPPPPPPPPPPAPEADGGDDEPTAVLTPPATDTTADIPAEGPPEAVPPAEGPPDVLPSPHAQKGRGAFVDPGDMEVDNWHHLEFVVGRNEAALAEESEDQELTRSKAIFVAPLMRVTLLPDPDFEIKPQSDVTQETGADRAASWQWMVKPLRGGSHALIAQVEVLERRPDGSIVSIETYKRRLAIRVRVGTWQGFLNALKGAATFGDILGTLFGSWGKTLTALTALIAAAVGLWAAIRKLRKPKE